MESTPIWHISYRFSKPNINPTVSKILTIEFIFSKITINILGGLLSTLEMPLLCIHLEEKFPLKTSNIISILIGLLFQKKNKKNSRLNKKIE